MQAFMFPQIETQILDIIVNLMHFIFSSSELIETLTAIKPFTIERLT